MYPTPHIQDFSTNLVGTTILSKVDLIKRYHQNHSCIGRHTKDRCQHTVQVIWISPDAFWLEELYSSFSTLDGYSMPSFRFCFCLVLNVSKCQFGQESLDFLGHCVTCLGITPLQEKVEATAHFPKPATIKGLQKLVGMVKFYCRFIPPKHGRWYHHSGKSKTLVWSDAITAAFEQTKQALANATMLSRPHLNVFHPHYKCIRLGHRSSSPAVCQWQLNSFLQTETVTTRNKVHNIQLRTTHSLLKDITFSLLSRG